jgi:hypothetical protein
VSVGRRVAVRHVADSNALLRGVFNISRSELQSCSLCMSSRRANGSAGEGEQYSADETFEEDVLNSDDGPQSDFEEEVSDFEEGLDDGDAKYDELDGGASHDARDSGHADGGEYEPDEYEPDEWDDADINHQARLHKSEPLSQPRSRRAKIVLPAAVVNNALSSNSVSLLTVSAFDVFLLSLMYAHSHYSPAPNYLLQWSDACAGQASATGACGDWFARRKAQAYPPLPPPSSHPRTRRALSSKGREKSKSA